MSCTRAGGSPRLQPSSESASRLEKLLDAVYDLVVIHKLAAVRGRNASVHSFDELRLAFKHAGDGFLDYLRGFFAFARGELFQLRFGIGCQMNFHLI